jgi:hypothetical protein
MLLVSSYGGGASPETRAYGEIVVVEPLASMLPEKPSAELETCCAMNASSDGLPPVIAWYEFMTGMRLFRRYCPASDSTNRKIKSL